MPLLTHASCGRTANLIEGRSRETRAARVPEPVGPAAATTITSTQSPFLAHDHVQPLIAKMRNALVAAPKHY